MIKPFTKNLRKSIKGPVYAIGVSSDLDVKFIYDVNLAKALKWNKRNKFAAFFVSNGGQDYYIQRSTAQGLVWHNVIYNKGNLAKTMCEMFLKTSDDAFFDFASFLDQNNLLHITA